MQRLPYLETHQGSIENCITLADRFYWNITVVEKNGKWAVLGGEKMMFGSDSREAVDAFLYGLGLAYSIIPEEYVERFRREFRP
ncbi:MAG: hypothetical protein K8L91_06130 [Anaerolineae bacterium]|nr:hypothetical protein [Anaerolineae bacterium]